MTLLFFSFFLFDHVTLQNATGKLFMSPVKNGKADFIQGNYCGRCRDPYSGVL